MFGLNGHLFERYGYLEGLDPWRRRGFMEKLFIILHENLAGWPHMWLLYRPISENNLIERAASTTWMGESLPVIPTWKGWLPSYIDTWTGLPPSCDWYLHGWMECAPPDKDDLEELSPSPPLIPGRAGLHVVGLSRRFIFINTGWLPPYMSWL